MKWKLSNQDVKRLDPRRGFTLIEVVTLAAILGLLALVALPALGKVRPNTQSAQCLSNMRVLATSWEMYAEDNNDRMVTSLHGNAAAGGAGDPTYGMGWASGWLDWTSSRDNTNTLFLVDSRYAKMAKYAVDPASFKCSADRYLSAIQRALNWPQRVRSYSDNLYIGEGDVEAGVFDPIYHHIKKKSEFQYPGPSEAWIFVEEHPDSINDPGLFSPYQTRWVDMPSSLHNGAAPFAFADGHAVMHKWQRSLAGGRSATVLYSDSAIYTPAPSGDPDLHFVSYGTPRASTYSY